LLSDGVRERKREREERKINIGAKKIFLELVGE